MDIRSSQSPFKDTLIVWNKSPTDGELVDPRPNDSLRVLQLLPQKVIRSNSDPNSEMTIKLFPYPICMDQDYLQDNLELTVLKTSVLGPKGLRVSITLRWRRCIWSWFNELWLWGCQWCPHQRLHPSRHQYLSPDRSYVLLRHSQLPSKLSNFTVVNVADG